MTDDDLAVFCDAGLYDPMAVNAAETRGLIERLVEQGWTPQEIVAATALEETALPALTAQAVAVEDADIVNDGEGFRDLT